MVVVVVFGAVVAGVVVLVVLVLVPPERWGVMVMPASVTLLAFAKSVPPAGASAGGV